MLELTAVTMTSHDQRNSHILSCTHEVLYKKKL